MSEFAIAKLPQSTQQALVDAEQCISQMVGEEIVLIAYKKEP